MKSPILFIALSMLLISASLCGKGNRTSKKDTSNSLQGIKDFLIKPIPECETCSSDTNFPKSDACYRYKVVTLARAVENGM